MRFQRFPRHDGPLHTSAQARAAVVRRQRLEREAAPLFAEEIAERQLPVDQVVAERQHASIVQHKASRSRQAADWRTVRGRLFALPTEGRALVRQYWADLQCPGNPMYLADIVSRFVAGRLRPEVERLTLLTLRLLGAWRFVVGMPARRCA